MKPDIDLFRWAVEHAGHNAIKKAPRWAHVKDVFGVGRSTAWGLCEGFNVDPDEEAGLCAACYLGLGCECEQTDPTLSPPLEKGKGRAMSKEKIDYWSCDKHQERLSAEDMNEAVEQHLDDLECVTADLPEKVTVYGYGRMDVSGHILASNPIEDLLDNLASEYGDPDDDLEDPSPAMLEAQKEFLTVVAREYKPWACEVVKTIKVNVLDWIREHRPDWIKVDPTLSPPLERRGQ